MFSIRQLTKEDWQLYKSLRIQAVKADPTVFAFTLEYEMSHTDEHWQDGLSNPAVAIFALFDDDKPIGMTGIAMMPEEKAKDTAKLWGSWIAKDYRRRGLSDYIYKARIEWAQNHPTCRTIIVSHRESNAASKGANQRHGFVWTHNAERIWPDGKNENEVFYKLELNKPPTPTAAPQPQKPGMG